MNQPPTFSEYVLAPLHPPVRDLRPVELDVMRQALLDAGVAPTGEGAAGSTPADWIVIGVSLLIVAGIVAYVSFQFGLWIASGGAR